MTAIISKDLYDELTERVKINKPILLKEVELVYINHARRASSKPLTEVQLNIIKKYVKNLFEG